MTKQRAARIIRGARKSVEELNFVAIGYHEKKIIRRPNPLRYADDGVYLALEMTFDGGEPIFRAYGRGEEEWIDAGLVKLDDHMKVNIWQLVRIANEKQDECNELLAFLSQRGHQKVVC